MSTRAARPASRVRAGVQPDLLCLPPFCKSGSFQMDVQEKGLHALHDQRLQRCLSYSPKMQRLDAPSVLHHPLVMNIRLVDSTHSHTARPSGRFYDRLETIVQTPSQYVTQGDRLSNTARDEITSLTLFCYRMRGLAHYVGENTHQQNVERLLPNCQKCVNTQRSLQGNETVFGAYDRPKTRWLFLLHWARICSIQVWHRASHVMTRSR